MKSPDQKIDASVQAFAKRWMSSLDRPRVSTTLGYFFVGLFLLFWSSAITSLLGFDLNKGIGVFVFIGVGILVVFPTIFFVKLMARLGVDRPTRSAFLFSAVIGPYVNMVAQQAWHIPVLSHMLGFVAAIFAFLFSLLLDRLIDSARRKPLDDK
jgi:hypothetical protein